MQIGCHLLAFLQNQFSLLAKTKQCMHLIFTGILNMKVYSHWTQFSRPPGDVTRGSGCITFVICSEKSIGSHVMLDTWKLLYRKYVSEMYTMMHKNILSHLVIQYFIYLEKQLWSHPLNIRIHAVVTLGRPWLKEIIKESKSQLQLYSNFIDPVWPTENLWV